MTVRRATSVLLLILVLAACGRPESGQAGVGRADTATANSPTEGPIPTISIRGTPAVAAQSTPASQPTVIVGNIAEAPAVAQLLAHLRRQGIEPQPADRSAVQWLSTAPGQAYRLGAGWLHIHLYPDAAAAKASADQIPPKLDEGAMRVVQWVAPPHFFRCNNLIALYLGEDAQVTTSLTEYCGPQFAGL